nr:hypothetical protein [Tanacetum cinerariifolium]
MSTPTFAKTHNLIACLAKPTESEGFKQIVDFLNGSSASYALTASPTIRTSCIKQFWTTTKLDDAEGTSCLANAEIFDGLAKMGYEKLSENLTFYKAFFSPPMEVLVSYYIEVPYIVKNIEAGVPFFIFPRFVQLLIDHQLGDMSHHKDIYDNPSLTKKVFANMKRVVTGFSGVVTALFENMLVLAVNEVDINEDVEINLEEAQAKPYRMDLEHQEKVLSMQDVDDEEPAEVKEVLEVVKAAKLMTEVVTIAGATTTAEATKGMTYSEIRPLFKKNYNYNKAFLEKVNEEVTVPEKEVEVKAHKKEDESLKKVITKKQKMDEEAEELKSHLQIVSNDDDDDVYTEATPLASKIPIVDYKIHFERNKPYFRIIRADGNHMLFLSFSTLLKNFNKEDLESLWKLVKESAIFLVVASLFFWQWHLSLLAVGSWSASGNSYNWQWVYVLPVGTLITGSGKLQASSESCSASRNSCESSNSNHLPSESNFPLEACSRSSQVPDPFLEGSPSLLA